MGDIVGKLIILEIDAVGINPCRFEVKEIFIFVFIIFSLDPFTFFSFDTEK
jgi:hypothetical protein